MVEKALNIYQNNAPKTISPHSKKEQEQQNKQQQ